MSEEHSPSPEDEEQGKNFEVGEGLFQCPLPDINRITFAEQQPGVEEGPPTTIIPYYENQIIPLTDRAQEAIVYHKVPVYQRAGKLVQPIWCPARNSEGHEIKITKFVLYNVKSLAYVFGKAHKDKNKSNDVGYTWVQFCKEGKEKKKKDGAQPSLFDRTEYVNIAPPEKLMSYLLSLSHWNVKRVNGISACPTMRPDGSIITKLGFDEATGLWLEWEDKLKLPPIAERPTREDALAALALYEELVAGFPFVSGVDKAVAIGAILTAVLRHAFPLAPIHFFRAEQSGTGKSYLVDVVAVVATGRACPVITVSDKKDEMDKQLGALLLEGAQLISLDNMTRDLDGELLNQIATQLTINVRILGKSETPECEFRGLVMATANNTHVVADMVRRVMVSNLFSGVERPELRPFEFKPVEKVQADRGRYIAAALTIARAYLVSGEKAECTPLASYEGWSRFVQEPLVWLGCADPVLSTNQSFEEDPGRKAARLLIELWEAGLNKEPLKVSQIIKLADETVPNEVVRNDGQPDWVCVRPDLRELLMERCGVGGRISPDRLGKWLAYLKGKTFNGGYRIVVDTVDAKKGNRWRLECPPSPDQG